MFAGGGYQNSTMENQSPLQVWLMFHLLHPLKTLQNEMMLTVESVEIYLLIMFGKKVKVFASK